MRLWTVQPIEVWEELVAKGYFCCDPKKSDNITDEIDSFKKPYDWLVSQMELRVGPKPFNCISYPIWAWHTRNWKHKKPDLREAGLGRRGDRAILIEFEKNDKDVLLSDFNNWHFVLNNWYLDDSLSEEEWERKHKYFDSLSPEKQRIKKLKSWEQIFDVRPFENEWRENGRYIQATCWFIRYTEVVSVREFICK